MIDTEFGKNLLGGSDFFQLVIASISKNMKITNPTFLHILNIAIQCLLQNLVRIDEGILHEMEIFILMHWKKNRLNQTKTCFASRKRRFCLKETIFIVFKFLIWIFKLKQTKILLFQQMRRLRIAKQIFVWFKRFFFSASFLFAKLKAIYDGLY